MEQTPSNSNSTEASVSEEEEEPSKAQPLTYQAFTRIVILICSIGSRMMYRPWVESSEKLLETFSDMNPVDFKT